MYNTEKKSVFNYTLPHLICLWIMFALGWGACYLDTYLKRPNKCQYKNDVLYCNEKGVVVEYSTLPLSEGKNWYVIVNEGVIR